MDEDETTYPEALRRLLIETPAAIWQLDDESAQCNNCGGPFTWFRRRHHCRWCGKLFCYNCCNSFAKLPVSSVSVDPTEDLIPQDMFIRDPDFLANDNDSQDSSWINVRVCVNCRQQLSELKELDLPYPITTCLNDDTTTRSNNQVIQSSCGNNLQRIEEPDDFVECPVCYAPLSSFKTLSERESHVANCLSNNSSSPRNMTEFLKHARRYISMQLSETSPCLGQECIICFEEFAAGDRVARIEYCLCIFHLKCYRDWLSTGAAGCPVHAATLHLS